MEYKKISLRVHKEGELVQLKDKANQFQIDLSGKDTNDLKIFFDNLFDEIIRIEQLIYFELEDRIDGELIHNVANDLIEQLNAEIRESEGTFGEIIKLNNALK